MNELTTPLWPALSALSDSLPGTGHKFLIARALQEIKHLRVKIAQLEGATDGDLTERERAGEFTQ